MCQDIAIKPSFLRHAKASSPQALPPTEWEEVAKLPWRVLSRCIPQIRWARRLSSPQTPERAGWGIHFWTRSGDSWEWSSLFKNTRHVFYRNISRSRWIGIVSHTTHKGTVGTNVSQPIKKSRKHLAWGMLASVLTYQVTLSLENSQVTYVRNCGL